MLQCEYSMSELDLRGSQSEALDVQLENDGDLVACSGRTGGELLGAFSSRVFDRGKHCLWGNEGLDNGKVTRVGAEGAPTGEAAIKLWRVLSESLYGEPGLGQRRDTGADESQVAVGQRVLVGWDDGQEHL